jgi:RNA polymerase-binding transcription factor DksA
MNARTTLPRASLRAALLVELAALEAQVAEHQSVIEDLSDEPGADALDRETLETALARASEAMADVEHALRTMDDGTYGTCERCGTAIAVERLEAIPQARHCVACQGGAGGLLR